MSDTSKAERYAATAEGGREFLARLDAHQGPRRPPPFVPPGARPAASSPRPETPTDAPRHVARDLGHTMTLDFTGERTACGVLPRRTEQSAEPTREGIILGGCSDERIRGLCWHGLRVLCGVCDAHSDASRKEQR